MGEPVERKVWPCPDCERTFNIPADADDPERCPDCSAKPTPTLKSPAADAQGWFRPDAVRRIGREVALSAATALAVSLAVVLPARVVQPSPAVNVDDIKSQRQSERPLSAKVSASQGFELLQQRPARLEGHREDAPIIGPLQDDGAALEIAQKSVRALQRELEDIQDSIAELKAKPIFLEADSGAQGGNKGTFYLQR